MHLYVCMHTFSLAPVTPDVAPNTMLALCAQGESLAWRWAKSQTCQMAKSCVPLG